jgi:hypothetical protein
MNPDKEAAIHISEQDQETLKDLVVDVRSLLRDRILSRRLFTFSIFLAERRRHSRNGCCRQILRVSRVILLNPREDNMRTNDEGYKIQNSMRGGFHVEMAISNAVL